MKNIGKNTILFLILLIPVLSEVSYSADRSPFDEPPRVEIVYDYAEAKNNCKITGIITTERDGKAILQMKEMERSSVYSINDRIPILSNGEIHEFTLYGIRDKSIVLKGKNGKTYEVEVR